MRARSIGRTVEGMPVIAIFVASVTVASPVVHVHIQAGAAQRDDFTRLEGEGAVALSTELDSFPRGAVLVKRLQSAVDRAPTADQRGRLALLWLRSLRWLLTSVPITAIEKPPYRDWLAQHETLVIYSDPAGQWLVVPELVWKVHDAHRSAANADEIAWFAVENGYPGECEGYVPCQANTLNWLHGEYLRRHPHGRHASEAVEQVRWGLNEALKHLSSDSEKRFLNPATDCGDLKAGLEPLRGAVLKSSVKERGEAIAVIDRLMAYCPISSSAETFWRRSVSVVGTIPGRLRSFRGIWVTSIPSS
jgi:hypothetical protein